MLLQPHVRLFFFGIYRNSLDLRRRRSFLWMFQARWKCSIWQSFQYFDCCCWWLLNLLFIAFRVFLLLHLNHALLDKEELLEDVTHEEPLGDVTWNCASDEHQSLHNAANFADVGRKTDSYRFVVLYLWVNSECYLEQWRLSCCGLVNHGVCLLDFSDLESLSESILLELLLQVDFSFLDVEVESLSSAQVDCQEMSLVNESLNHRFARLRLRLHDRGVCEHELKLIVCLKELDDFVIGGAFFPTCLVTQPKHQLHILEHLWKVIALQMKAAAFGEIRTEKIVHKLLRWWRSKNFSVVVQAVSAPLKWYMLFLDRVLSGNLLRENEVEFAVPGVERFFVTEAKKEFESTFTRVKASI